MCSHSFNASCRYHFHSLPVDIIIYQSVSFPLGIVKNNKFAIAFCFPWIWLVVYAIIIITSSTSATPYHMHQPRTNRNSRKIIPHIILFILPRSLCLCQFPFFAPLHRDGGLYSTLRKVRGWLGELKLKEDASTHQ